MAYIKKFVFPSIILAALIILAASIALNNGNKTLYWQPNQDEISATQSRFECRINQNFPQEILVWEEYIMHASAASDLDPNLIAAVILQESGGQEHIISHSGAVGLMQIMPRDGVASRFICVNGPCFHNRPTTKELLDPQFNIQYGAQLLAGLLNTHPALRDALKAYGPMDVGHSYADTVLAIYNSKI